MRCKLEQLDMRTDMEMTGAKIRYQIHKENRYRDIDENEDMENFLKKEKIIKHRGIGRNGENRCRR